MKLYDPATDKKKVANVKESIGNADNKTVQPEISGIETKKGDKMIISKNMIFMIIGGVVLILLLLLVFMML